MADPKNTRTGGPQAQVVQSTAGPDTGILIEIHNLVLAILNKMGAAGSGAMTPGTNQPFTDAAWKQVVARLLAGIEANTAGLAGGHGPGGPGAGPAPMPWRPRKARTIPATGGKSWRPGKYVSVAAKKAARALRTMQDPERMKTRGASLYHQGHTKKGRAWFAAGEAADAAGNTGRRGEAFGQMLGAAGTAVGGVPGVGKPAEAVLKFGEELFKTGEKLREWGQRLHDANMQFADVSPAMAGVGARQYMRDIHQRQTRGGALADSAEGAAQGNNRWETMMQGPDILAGKFQNLLGQLKGVMADVLEMTQIPEFLRIIAGQKKSEGRKDYGFDLESEKGPLNPGFGRPGRFGE